MTNLLRVREQANTHYSEPSRDKEVGQVIFSHRGRSQRGVFASEGSPCESFRCVGFISNHDWSGLHELFVWIILACWTMCRIFLCLTEGKQGSSHRSRSIMLHSPQHTANQQPITYPLCSIPYLTVCWSLAKLGDGLIKFCLLLGKVLLVEPKQLLAFFILLLKAWWTKG